MRDTGRNVLALALADAGSFLAHSRFLSRPGADLAEPISPGLGSARDRHFVALARHQPARAVGTDCSLDGYFFLPAIALAGPLRVRALVWVRWPRTGRPRRCRNPR